MHEGGIRVPGILRWPGRLPAGVTSSYPVIGTDYLPTLCAVAGAKVPSDRVIDGVNIMPALLEGRPSPRRRPMFWWLYHARGGKEVAMRVGNRKILANMIPQAAPGSIQDARPAAGMTRMEFIKKTHLENFVAYDLEADPRESAKLTGKQAGDLEQLEQQFIKLFREVQQEGPVWRSIKPSKKRPEKR